MHSQFYFSLLVRTVSRVLIDHSHNFPQCLFCKIQMRQIDRCKQLIDFSLYSPDISFFVIGFKKQVSQQFLIFLFKACQAEAQFHQLRRFPRCQFLLDLVYGGCFQSRRIFIEEMIGNSNICKLTTRNSNRIMTNNNSTVTHSFDSSPESALHYDEFLGPMFFEPYAIEVADRINPSSVSVALEIAAGTGRVTRHIRKRISASAKLIASDISETMLTVAKEKLTDPGIDWQKIDAQQLPFSDNSIDLVVCCFGYMFVPDKPKAFAEAYRVLRPGGMFLITTWDKLENNAASYTSRSQAMKYFEGPMPETFNLATSMHDEVAIRKMLTDAAFARVSVEKVRKNSVCPTAQEAAAGLVQSGQIFQEIKKRNPAWIEEIKAEVEKILAEKFGAAPMIAPMSALVSQAWK
jgi:ubiquinone/menaquinone biosynthesis C-methylase UbiE